MQSGTVEVALDPKGFYLRLKGDVRVPWCVSLETFCETAIGQIGDGQVYVDLTLADNLDSTTLGVLAKVAIMASRDTHHRAMLLCDNEDLLRLAMSMGFEQVFEICSAQNQKLDHISYRELPLVDCSEGDMQDAVIDAHQTLIDMTEDNRQAFEGLVDALKEKRSR